MLFPDGHKLEIGIVCGIKLPKSVMVVTFVGANSHHENSKFTLEIDIPKGFI